MKNVKAHNTVAKMDSYMLKHSDNVWHGYVDDSKPDNNAQLSIVMKINLGNKIQTFTDSD